MTLYFDLVATQPTGIGKFHGGGEYAKKIFLELIKRKNNFKLHGVYNPDAFLDPTIKLAVDQNNIELIDYRNLNSIKVNNNNSVRFYSALPYNIRKEFLNVINKGIYTICTIHGLRNFETPIDKKAVVYEGKLLGKIKIILQILFSRKRLKKEYNFYYELFSKVDKIISVSENSKFYIENFFPGTLKKIEVYYSPDVSDIESKEDEDTSNNNLNYQSYFLLVSGNRWIKNNLTAIQALDDYFTERPYVDKKAVITGVSNKKLFLKLVKNKERFIFYKYVSRNHLTALHKNAFALLYLSSNEGFGYPPIESMKYGVPVIASPFTSITEICENAPLYTNPLSKDEIKNRILQLYDKRIYNRVKERSLLQYNRIHDRQAEDLNILINQLLNEKIN